MAANAPYDYLPIIIQLALVLGFVGATIAATHLIGPKRKTADKLETFECGIEIHGNARSPFSIKYFLVAILFVLFDVEIIFMYPWAVNFKSLGWFGFMEMLTFIAFLMAGFYYILKFLMGGIKLETGFLSLILSIWFLSGVIIFILGILGLYLQRVFALTKQRPLFVESKKINI